MIKNSTKEKNCFFCKHKLCICKEIKNKKKDKLWQRDADDQLLSFLYFTDRPS